MRGPKTTATVAQKKLNLDTTKKTKVDKSTAKKEKASNKNSGAPKRPPSAFFVFIIDRSQPSLKFETACCELDLDLRLMRFGSPIDEIWCSSQVAKEGGVKWKSMSDSEKAPYVAKAARKKAEYEIAIKQHNDDLNETAPVSKSSSLYRDPSLYFRDIC
ncbi:hypothetical protein L1987_49465 [Smallanthus sonchifolius]|uniref:Uncharacterized protein n=1 Tax=Smallanthus sonchifolius TaxID=185202 RepID=A0ACB9FUL0_9ASTR|nr:hypothetical protein L1987_49465 [Smallanthus sonchifolius]